MCSSVPIQLSNLPSRIHNYVFLEAIGRGGYSTVYKVYDERYNQYFAAKCCKLDNNNNNNKINNSNKMSNNGNGTKSASFCIPHRKEKLDDDDDELIGDSILNGNNSICDSVSNDLSDKLNNNYFDSENHSANKSTKMRNLKHEVNPSLKRMILSTNDIDVNINFNNNNNCSNQCESPLNQVFTIQENNTNESINTTDYNNIFNNNEINNTTSDKSLNDSIINNQNTVLDENSNNNIDTGNRTNNNCNGANKCNNGSNANNGVQFEGEIRSLMSLDHPNIIRMYNYFTEGGFLFIILELCPNGSLEEFIKCCKPNNEIRMSFVRQIMSAIHLCHSKNIAHRDIKLSNILLDENFRPKLADFGLSVILQTKSATYDQYNGSLMYLPPEILLKSPYDPFKADIWSLGVLVYIILMGHSPWMTKNFEEMKKAIAAENYQAVHPSMKNFSDLIKRMIIRDPTKRSDICILMKDKSVFGENNDANNYNNIKDNININDNHHHNINSNNNNYMTNNNGLIISEYNGMMPTSNNNNIYVNRTSSASIVVPTPSMTAAGILKFGENKLTPLANATSHSFSGKKKRSNSISMYNKYNMCNNVIGMHQTLMGSFVLSNKHISQPNGCTFSSNSSAANNANANNAANPSSISATSSAGTPLSMIPTPYRNMRKGSFRSSCINSAANINLLKKV